MDEDEDEDDDEDEDEDEALFTSSGLYNFIKALLSHFWFTR